MAQNVRTTEPPRLLIKQKLTLRLDENLIARAKAISKAQGKFVSQLVADYFAALDAKTLSDARDELPPGVRSLLGVMRESETNAEHHREHLAEKHHGAKHKSSRQRST